MAKRCALGFRFLRVSEGSFGVIEGFPHQWHADIGIFEPPCDPYLFLYSSKSIKDRSVKIASRQCRPNCLDYARMKQFARKRGCSLVVGEHVRIVKCCATSSTENEPSITAISTWLG